MAHATLLEARGKYDEAEILRRRNIKTFEIRRSLDATDLRLERIFLAANLKRQGRLLEAETVAREVSNATAYSHGTELGFRGLAIRELVAIINEQGRAQDAETLARAAIDVYASAGVPESALVVGAARENLGIVLASQRRWSDAAAEFDSIARNLSTTSPTVRAFLNDSVHAGTAYLMAGRPDDASFSSIAHSPASLSLSAQLPMGPRKSLVYALPLPSSANIENALPRTRSQRLRIITDHYLDLMTQSGVVIPSDSDSMNQVFQLAEVSRFDEVQRSLSTSATRSTLSADASLSPELAKLVRRDLGLQRETSALLRSLSASLNRPIENQRDEVEAELRREIERNQRSIILVRSEITEQFPDYAALTTPKPPTIEELRNALNSGETVVSTYVALDRTYVWAVPWQGPVALHVAPLGRSDLDEMIGAIRRSLDVQAQSLSDIPEFDLALAHRLYEILFAPIAFSWGKSTHLLVAADGALGQLPLSLLPTELSSSAEKVGPTFSEYGEVPWLIRDIALMRIPSIASLIVLRSLPARESSEPTFAGFGDPFYTEAHAEDEASVSEQTPPTGGGRSIVVRALRETISGNLDNSDIATRILDVLQRLPETRAEILEIASQLGASPDRDVFLGNEPARLRSKQHNYRTAGS